MATMPMTTRRSTRLSPRDRGVVAKAASIACLHYGWRRSSHLPLSPAVLGGLS